MPNIRTTRAQEARVETYTPPSSYDLPPEVIKAFNNKGLHVRYVRVLLDNNEDYKNVADRKREGYEFVTLSELPDDLRGLYETKSFGIAAQKFNDVVIVGDLALMKIPLAKANARKRYYEDLAKQAELATKGQLTKDQKMNKMLPMYDESETIVRTGGRKSSPGEFGKTLKSTQASDEDGDDE